MQTSRSAPRVLVNVTSPAHVHACQELHELRAQTLDTDWATGVDTIAFSFLAETFDPDHPRVNWTMRAGKEIGPISSEPWVPMKRKDWLALDIHPCAVRDHFEAFPLENEQLANAKGNWRPEAVYDAHYWPHPRCHLHIKVEEQSPRTGGQLWVRIECNVARLHDPDGWGLCPPALVEAYVVALMAWLQDFGLITRLCPHTTTDPSVPSRSGSAAPPLPRMGPPSSDWTGGPCREWECLQPRLLPERDKRRFGVDSLPEHRGVRVHRLDVACDFRDVGVPGLWLQAMSTSRGYESPGRTTAVVRLSSKSRVQAYDKRQEAVDKRQTVRAPQGTLRVEVQHRRPALEYRGIKCISDVTPGAANRILIEGMARAGLDRIIGGSRTDVAAPAAGMTQRAWDNLINWLHAVRRGDPPVLSDKTSRERRRIAAQLGLVVGRAPDENLGPACILDPVLGAELRPSSAWLRLHGAIADT